MLSTLVLLSALSLGYLALNQVQADARASIESSLAEQVHLLKQVYEPPMAGLKPLPLITSQQRITVLDPLGVVLYDNKKDARLMENHLTRPEIALAASGGGEIGMAERFSATLNQEMLYLALTLGPDSSRTGYIRVSMPLTSIDEKVDRVRDQTLMVTVLLTALFLLIGLYFTRKIVLPMLQMTSASRSMAAGEFSLRIPEDRQDELGQLAQALNQLAAGTEEKMLEVSARRNELAAVLQGMTEGVVALGRASQVIHMNDAACRILQISAEAAQDQSFASLHSHDDLNQLVKQGWSSLTSGFQSVQLGDLSVEVSVLMPVDQAPTGMLLVIKDVSELLRLERVRTDFVANASHELKTPISALRGFIDTLADDESMPSEIRTSFLNRSQQQVLRLGAIVQDLMQLSRLEAGQVLPYTAERLVKPLIEAVYETQRLDAELQQIHLDLEISPSASTARIHTNQGDFSQMIANLVENAVQYSDAGQKVLIKAFDQQNSIVVQVIDQGSGIPKKEHDKIFERFYRVDQARSRDAGGTGLGLSIVKHIAERHRGRVVVTSSLGTGSTFSVTIPLV
ncbi:MAG: ATP-binding protein [Pseudomonadales bacterium]|nr:ATP-binding protein [Pseudomonadales bacterium]